MKKTKKAPPAPMQYGPDIRPATLPDYIAIHAAMGYLPQLRPFSDYTMQMDAAIRMRANLDAYIAEMHACNGYSAMMRRMGEDPTVSNKCRICQRNCGNSRYCDICA